MTISVEEGTLRYHPLDFRIPLDGDDVSGEVAFDVPEGDVVIDYAPQGVPGAALFRVEG